MASFLFSVSDLLWELENRFCFLATWILHLSHLVYILFLSVPIIFSMCPYRLQHGYYNILVWVGCNDVWIMDTWMMEASSSNSVHVQLRVWRVFLIKQDLQWEGSGGKSTQQLQQQTDKVMAGASWLSIPSARTFSSHSSGL